MIRLRFPLWLDPVRPAAAVPRRDPRLARPRGRPAALGRYGLLPTDAAVSDVDPRLMLASLSVSRLLLGTLAVTNWTLLARHAARGAADPALGRPRPTSTRRAPARPPPSPE